MPPVEPMLAKAVASIPVGHRYEPKWDGFRAILFRDGDWVEIGSRNTKPIQRYFPEVVDAALAHLPARCVVDGEIVLPSGVAGGLDFEALQARIHPAESRVQLLARQTPALLVVFDVLALGADALTRRPFAERRASLEYTIGVVSARAAGESARARRPRGVRGAAGRGARPGPGTSVPPRLRSHLWPARRRGRTGAGPSRRGPRPGP
jgi:ATP-dependent DNA ligase